MIPSRLSGKAEKAYRIVDAVKLNNNIFGVRVIVKKEPVSSGTSGNNSQNGEVDRPALHTDSSIINIRNLLQYVNDNLEQPYVNLDGTPNYGIYFGDNETGGVMYITPKDTTYE